MAEKARRQRPARRTGNGGRVTKQDILDYIEHRASAPRPLQQFPAVNASVEGDSIRYHRHVNAGIAVALDWGLIVPVLKNADELNFLGLQRAITDLGERARSKKLVPSDVEGATFTITNPGQFGAVFGLPIINQPNVAIMGVGGIRRVVACSNSRH